MWMVGRWMMVTLVLGLNWVSAQIPKHRVRINPSVVLNTVEPEFLSFTLDSYAFLPSPSNTFLQQDPTDPRLVNLMSALAPAYFRVGGTYSSYVAFDYNMAKMGITSLVPRMYSMTPTQWDFLVALTRNTGTQLLFDLNAQLLYGNEWMPANAIKLFDYCASKGYGENLHFELGNEPTTYEVHDGQPLNDWQIADSINKLRSVLDSYPSLNSSKVVGPDMVDLSTDANQALLSGIVELCGQNLHAVTVHHYNMADAADWQSLVDEAEFDELATFISTVQGIVAATSNSGVPVWLGETGDAASSSTDATSSYAAGLLWLDKLGLAARNGINVVMRQAFYGSSNGLVDLNYFPKPDYWLSALYKKLVGQKVLDLWFPLGGDYVRSYAHCAETSNGEYTSSDVVIYALNLNQTSDVDIAFASELRDKTMHVYHVVPDGDDPEDMLALHVSLGGVRLALENGDTTLPAFNYVSKDVNSRYTLPSLQYVFFVVLGVNAPACL